MTSMGSNYEIFLDANTAINIQWDTDKNATEPYYGSGRVIEVSILLLDGTSGNNFFSVENFVKLVNDKLRSLPNLLLSVSYNRSTEKYELIFDAASKVKAVRFNSNSGMVNIFTDIMKYTPGTWYENADTTIESSKSSLAATFNVETSLSIQNKHLFIDGNAEQKETTMSMFSQDGAKGPEFKLLGPHLGNQVPLPLPPALADVNNQIENNTIMDNNIQYKFLNGTWYTLNSKAILKLKSEEFHVTSLDGKSTYQKIDNDNIILQKDTKITNNLHVEGKITGAVLEVEDIKYVHQSVVQNDGDLDIDGNLEISGTSTCTGLVTSNGGIDVLGGSFNVSGESKLSGTTTIEGVTNITNNTTITGETTLDNKLTLNGNLISHGDIDLIDNTDPVNPVTRFQVVKSTGNMTISGNMNINGTITNTDFNQLQTDVSTLMNTSSNSSDSEIKLEKTNSGITTTELKLNDNGTFISSTPTFTSSFPTDSVLSIISTDPGTAPYGFSGLKLTMGGYNHSLGMSQNSLNIRAKGDSTSGEIKMFTGDGTTETVTLLSDGKVGIGQVSPAYSLDITGDLNFTGTLYHNGSPFVSSSSVWSESNNVVSYGDGTNGTLKINSADGVDKIQLTSSGTNGSKINHSTGWLIDYKAGTGNDAGPQGGHSFYTTESSSYQERLRITSDGKIGIGLTDPIVSLHVNGGAFFDGDNSISSSTTTIDAVPTFNSSNAVSLLVAGNQLGPKPEHGGLTGSNGYTIVSRDNMTLVLSPTLASGSHNLRIYDSNGNNTGFDVNLTSTQTTSTINTLQKHAGVALGSHNNEFGHLQIISSHDDGGWIDWVDDTGSNDYIGRIRYGVTNGFDIYSANGVTMHANTEIKGVLQCVSGARDGVIVIGENSDQTAGNNNLYLRTYRADGATYTDIARFEDVRTNNTDASVFHMYGDMNASGKIGVGTTSPSYSLEVVDSNYVQAIIRSNTASQPGHLVVNNNVNNEQIQFATTYTHSDTYASYNQIFTYNGSGLSSLFINQNLFLDGNNRVGIGTFGPDRKLDILDASNPQLRLTHTDGSAGSDLQSDVNSLLTIAPVASSIENVLKVKSTSSVSRLHIERDSGNSLEIGLSSAHAFLWNADTQPIQFGVGGSEKMIIKNDGRVGIGTSSPNAKLHIHNTGNSNPFQVNMDDYTYAQFVANQSGAGISIYAGGHNFYINSWEGEGRIDTYDSSKALVLQGSGGQCSIMGSLHVNHRLYCKENSTNGVIVIGDNSDQTAVNNFLYFRTYRANATTYDDIAYFEDVRTNTADSSIFHMIGNIRASGRIGIGTNSPQSALHVVGALQNISASPGVHIGDHTNGNYAMEIVGTSSSWGGYIDFNYDGSNNTDHVARFKCIFRDSSNLSASFTPYFQFDNEVKVIGDTKVIGNITATGTITPNSDDRLKHNEVNIQNGLDSIMKLSAQNYDKTTDLKEEDFHGELKEGTFVKDSGFIAQEVYMIDEFKHLVSVGDENTPWSINYNGLFTYNIQATQELKQKVDEQQSEIKTLQSEIKFLQQNVHQKGMIIMWSGSINEIPNGWHLCDGQQGTPDLQNKFVMGCSPQNPIGKTGGQKEIKLSEDQLPSHNHSIDIKTNTSENGEHSHEFHHIYTSKNDTVTEIHDKSIIHMSEFNDVKDLNNSGWYTKNVNPTPGHDHSIHIQGNTKNTGQQKVIDITPSYYTLAYIMKL